MQEKVLTTVKKLHLKGLMFHRTAFFKVVDCRLLVVRCRLLVVGYRLLVVGYRLLVVGRRLYRTN